jgi:YesN/AraC family two-component response regulator
MTPTTLFAVKYRNSGLAASAAERLAFELDHYIKTEKLFKDSNLKLQTLATRLNTRIHYVSQAINQCYQLTFFEYLNRKRIEAAKELLQSDTCSDFRIIEIAYAVGYNNKNTFNSAFKRLTGLTPREYRQSKFTEVNNNLGNTINDWTYAEARHQDA